MQDFIKGVRSLITLEYEINMNFYPEHSSNMQKDHLLEKRWPFFKETIIMYIIIFDVIYFFSL